MAKGVILITDIGTMLLGTTQCSNGCWWDAQGCFNYCNNEEIEYFKQHQAQKLKFAATELSSESKEKDNKYWFKNIENFIDIKIPYEVDQSYKDHFKEKNKPCL